MGAGGKGGWGGLSVVVGGRVASRGAPALASASDPGRVAGGARPRPAVEDRGASRGGVRGAPDVTGDARPPLNVQAGPIPSPAQEVEGVP